MATSKEYMSFILEQLSNLEEISSRSMMGEYIIYYKGKIAAYVCDNRLLVKPVEAAKMEFLNPHIKAQRICCWWNGWTVQNI
jgi:TfoX/Sxy family transcriptional regulator of competence genes